MKSGRFSVTAMPDFVVHFRLNDEGEFDFEGLGEAAEEHIIRRSYPILDKAFMEKGNIRDAVGQERARLWPKDDSEKKKVKQPQTQLGRDIKALTDAPTKMLSARRMNCSTAPAI